MEYKYRTVMFYTVDSIVGGCGYATILDGNIGGCGNPTIPDACIGVLESKGFMDGFELTLDAIPEKIEALDLFLMRSNNFFKAMEECTLVFFANDEQECFTYHYKMQTMHPNLFCGSFARVSDGWKFYPKFKEHSNSETQVVSLYKTKSIL